MAYIRRINPIEVEFYYWTHNYPESFHPYDRRRFYSFVDTVLRYRKTEGRKWLNKQYFFDCCEKDTSLTIDQIESYWKRMEIILDYRSNHRSYPKKKYIQFDERHFVYELQMILDGRLETIQVDEATYRKKYIGKKEFLMLLHKESA